MNDLATTSHAVAAFNPEQVELIKRTVAKGATNDELSMFMYLANRYELDPFAKEIWFIKRGSDPTIMTSRDGYLKIAQANPDYLGLISFAVCEGDHFEIDAANYSVTHKFGTKRGNILGAWARCDRKGRSPQICFVPYKEYAATGPVWKQYPSAMIQKVAEVFVLKRQFGISGLVTREELDSSDQPVQQPTPTKQSERPQTTPPQGETTNTITVAQQRRIFAIAKDKGIDTAGVKVIMSDLFPEKQSTKDLTPTEMDRLTSAFDDYAIDPLQDDRTEPEVLPPVDGFDPNALELTQQELLDMASGQ